MPGGVFGVAEEGSPRCSEPASWAPAACRSRGSCQSAMEEQLQHHDPWQGKGHFRWAGTSKYLPGWFVCCGNLHSMFFLSAPVSPDDGNSTSLKCCSMASEISMRGTQQCERVCWRELEPVRWLLYLRVSRPGLGQLGDLSRQSHHHPVCSLQPCRERCAMPISPHQRPGCRLAGTYSHLIHM